MRIIRASVNESPVRTGRIIQGLRRLESIKPKIKADLFFWVCDRADEYGLLYKLAPYTLGTVYRPAGRN